MPTSLETEALPRLELRAPTAGPLFNPQSAREFADALIQPSGVHDPTVLVINLEGRYPSASALYEMLVPLAGAIRSGVHGTVALVVATPDPALGEVIRSIAQAHDLPIFLARSKDELSQAEPLAPLSASERDTLAALSRLGGRASVSMLAKASGIDHTAAGNRLANLDEHQMVLRVTRPRREGYLYLDPRVAVPPEEPADAGDIGLPAAMRADVRTLADLQGRAPAAVLAEVWREFLTKHREQLAAEYNDAARNIKEGDRAALGAYVGRGAAKKVKRKARRTAQADGAP